MSQCHDVYDPTEFPTTTDYCPSGAHLGRHHCEFVSHVRDKVHVLRVVGSLDWSTEKRFIQLFREQCKEPIVIVDLTASRFDAGGTGGLVLATELARERRQQLVLIATDPLQLAVMISTGLNIVVPIVSSEGEAVTWCKRHGIQAWTGEHHANH